MLALMIGLAILLLDQLTKQAVRSFMVYGESRSIINGLFNLVYVRNDGAAWNVLAGQSVILILISVAVLILLVLYRRSFLRQQLSHRILLGFMIGGILGNLVDRIRFGWVTDFLDFHLGAHHWPSFNVADSAIFIAVFLYMYTNAMAERAKQKSPESE